MPSSYGYSPTVFPGGTGAKVAYAAGTSAGSVTFDTSFGIEVGDLVEQVVALTIDTDGTFSTALDLTSEFTRVVTGANNLTNTGGTDTTGAILVASFHDVDAAE